MTLHQYMLKKTTEYALSGELSKLYNLGYAKGRWDAAKAYCGEINRETVRIDPSQSYLVEIEKFLDYEDR